MTHPMIFSQGRVDVCSLDRLFEECGNFVPEEKAEAPLSGLAAALQVNPQRDIIKSIDPEAWTGSLPERDQEFFAMRQACSTLKDIGEHLDTSISMVHSRLNALGLLADRAGLPVVGAAQTAA